MKDERTGLDVASVGDAEGVAALVGLDAPTADASLEALGRIVRAAWVEVAKKEAKTVPGYVDLWKWLEIPDADTDRKIGEQVVRAVDASRPAAAIERTLNINALARCARAALRIEVPDVVAWEALPEAERVGWRAVVRCILASTTLASRPGLTEEQAADLRERAAFIAETCSGGDHTISNRDLIARRIRELPLRASRGETGPARVDTVWTGISVIARPASVDPAPTWGERAIEADALAEIARKALDAAPAADASLEARGEALGRALCAKLGPGIVAPPAYFRAACIDLVRAVDASRSVPPAVDPEDLWTDYRTGRGTVFASDRKAFLAGVAAGRRTREPDMGAADASRPGLTGDAWTALAQVIATLAENDSLVDDAIAAAERAGCPDATVLHLHEINDAMYRRRLRGSRPGLTEEQADAIALGCLQVREDLQRHAIKRAILRVDRGETGPATEPTRAERVAEAQRLRAEARAEAEACTVPMPADLLARYPRSADPPQPDRPSGLTRAMHDAQTRPSVAPAIPSGGDEQ